MPILRLFASAREAAGVARADFPGSTVAEMLDGARAAYGDRFSAVVARSRIWVNGEPASTETVVHGHDVVAVLPPVSGGAGEATPPERTARRPDGAAGGERPGREAQPREGRSGGPTRPPAGTRRSPAADARQRPARRGEASGAMGRLGGGPDVGPRRPATPTDGGRLTRPVAPAEAGHRGHPRHQAEPDRRPATDVRPAAAPLVTLPGREGEEPASAPEKPSPAKPSARAVGLGMRQLTVVYRTTRPHGRIGVLWAIATVAVTIPGQAWLAGWLSLIVFVGASQATGARRAIAQRPPPALAAVLAAAAPIAAVFGVRYLVAVVGGGLALALVTGGLGHGRGPRDLAVAMAVGAVLGAAAAAPVITREDGIAPVLFLFACMAAYDAGAYLVGTGASSAWEGPVAGMAAMIPVTLIGAIILSPPYPSGTPLGLGALAACLAPLGPLVGTVLVGSREADAPGLRRLDSLILLGPVWAWFSTSLLR